MTRIAYILLAHKNPAALIAQVRLLTSQGDAVALHFDRSASPADWRRVRSELRGVPGLALARRVHCGWGEWSLVQATLNALEAALRAFPDASHFLMLSGDCSPIKPRSAIVAALEEGDRDYIEHHDFFESGWIRTGLKEERLIYRHFVNERSRKWLFYALLTAQQWLGLKRPLPEGVNIRIGSQWWALRRRTVERVLALLARRRDLVRFFRWSWIPDETFFQTLVLHVTPRAEVENRPLTLIAFTDYGLPLVFHDDHLDLLLGQRDLFARKISANAVTLRTKLAAVYAGTEPPGPADAATLRPRFEYLAGRGRIGRRAAPRIWDERAGIGAGRELLLLACRKWHVGKRLAGAIGAATGLPAYGYVFDETEAGLPDLGHVGSSADKRRRHRRAFLRVVFDATGAERLLICVDSGNLDVIADFAADACSLRVLDLAATLDDGWLAGHAERIGLVAAGEPPQAILATLRRQVEDDAAGLVRLGLPVLCHLAQSDPEGLRARTLAGFLGVTEEVARGIVGSGDIFS